MIGIMITNILMNNNNKFFHIINGGIFYEKNIICY